MIGRYTGTWLIVVIFCFLGLESHGFLSYLDYMRIYGSAYSSEEAKMVENSISKNGEGAVAE